MNITPEEACLLIETYLDAKDNNLPELMPTAFHPDAEVRMAVNAQAISFPAHMLGASRTLRIGCGHYNWHFSRTDCWRVQQLDITIIAMEILPDSDHIDVRGWTRALQRPWTRADAALALLPSHPRLESVRQAMGECRR